MNAFNRLVNNPPTLTVLDQHDVIDATQESRCDAGSWVPTGVVTGTYALAGAHIDEQADDEHRLDQKPIERTAFVFLDEANARNWRSKPASDSGFATRMTRTDARSVGATKAASIVAECRARHKRGQSHDRDRGRRPRAARQGGAHEGTLSAGAAAQRWSADGSALDRRPCDERTCSLRRLRVNVGIEFVHQRS